MLRRVFTYLQQNFISALKKRRGTNITCWGTASAGVIDTRLLSSVVLYILGGGIIALGGIAFQLYSEDALLFTMSGFILIFSCILMHRSVRLFHFRRLTIPGFWYLTYLAMIYIPSFFVYYDVQGRSRHIYLFAVHSVLLTVPFGMIIVNRIRNFQPVEIHRYFEKPLKEYAVGLHHFTLIGLGVVMALGLVAMHVSEMGTIPLFYMIQNPGDALVTSLLRENALKLLNSPFTYFYTLLINVGYPFLILTTLGYFLITRQFKWFVLFCIAASSGLLYMALGTAKGPAAAVIVQISLFIYLYRRGTFSKKAFILSHVLIFVFPLVVVMSSHESTLDLALWSLGQRLFYSPALTVYWYFELFPGHTDYLYGMSIGRLAWLLGVEPFDTPNYVAMEGLRMRMESANANGAFIGNLNADFGIVGVLCGGVVAGVLMQMIQVSLLRYPKTVFNLVVYAFCVFAFWNLHSTALPVVLMTNGVLFVLVFSWLIQRSINMLRIGVTEIKPLPPTPS